MADPEHVKKLEDQGLAIKVMVGDEYAKYFADTHAKARKYTEWAEEPAAQVAPARGERTWRRQAGSDVGSMAAIAASTAAVMARVPSLPPSSKGFK